MQAGSIVYVAKNVEYRFHSIEEVLTVIVFFALTEYSNKWKLTAKSTKNTKMS